MLNGAAANLLVVSIVFLLVFCLIFSFRDTIQGIGEFFDIRAIRRLLRKPLVAVLLGACLVAFVPAVAFAWLVPGGGENLLLLVIFAGLLLVPGLSLAWLLVSEALDQIRAFRRRR